MLGYIKKMFIGLLTVKATESFGESLTSYIKGSTISPVKLDQLLSIQTLFNLFIINSLLPLVNVVEVMILTIHLLEYVCQGKLKKWT